MKFVGRPQDLTPIIPTLVMKTVTFLRKYLGYIMKNGMIIFFVCVSFFACASEDYKKNIQGIIEFELNEDLNKLSANHIKCFICETGECPQSVSQIIELEPESLECKNLFTKQFNFIDPAISSYKITTKDWDDRVTFVFTENGATYDELESVNTSMAMNIARSDLECPLKD